MGNVKPGNIENNVTDTDHDLSLGHPLLKIEPETADDVPDILLIYGINDQYKGRIIVKEMSVMGDVVKAAESAGIRNKVKIMIGGAPITQEFCDKIGADVYTVDAASAADAAVELCKA